MINNLNIYDYPVYYTFFVKLRMPNDPDYLKPAIFFGWCIESKKNNNYYTWL